jgi:cytoskeletal protein RodZ
VNKLNQEQVAQLHSIGSFLHQRRLELGINLEEVTAITRIRASILRAIEDGDTTILPEPIYLRGLIHRYGDILEVDGQTLAETFPLESTPLTSEIITPLPESSLSDRFTEVIETIKPYGQQGLILGGVLVGIAAIFTFRQPVTEAIAKLRLNKPAQNTAAVEPIASPTTPILASPIASPAAEPGVEATIKLSADSWLQISIDGKVEFEGTLNGGTERKFTGKKQISISAGNAGAVSVAINREPAKPLGNLGEVKEAVFTASN